jgi:hypothetical protein
LAVADTEDSLGSNEDSLGSNEEFLTPDGEPLQGSPKTRARRREIANALARAGLLSNERAEADNPAVDVLAALLPRDADIELCLSCHKSSASQAYPFHEATGLLRRPSTSLAVSGYFSGGRVVPPTRTDLVLCTEDALLWTRSAPRIKGTRVVGDDVTLCSVPFSEILGAVVHNRHKGELKVWLDDATLSFETTPSEVDSLCAYIERAATSDTG